MRKDTKTFLSAVLGVPLFLSGVWGFNAANEASTVVFQREQVANAEPEIQKPVEVPKEKITIATTTAPSTKPVPVKSVTQPMAVPTPIVVPVVTPVVTPAPAEPTPTPVVVKKSRRTHAS
ncbi:MAG: hypothetical protein WAV21_03350 [Minisyncoccia bacterium]